MWISTVIIPQHYDHIKLTEWYHSNWIRSSTILSIANLDCFNFIRIHISTSIKQISDSDGLYFESEDIGLWWYLMPDWLIWNWLIRCPCTNMRHDRVCYLYCHLKILRPCRSWYVRTILHARTGYMYMILHLHILSRQSSTLYNLSDYSRYSEDYGS